MEMSKLSDELRTLNEKEQRVIYETKQNVRITVTQTGKHSEDDYAVGLIVSEQPEFYPTHIRLLIDLYIKRESNPDGARKLFNVLEKVYNGNDPKNFLNEINKINFPMSLDEAETNLYVAQLLMIEQDFNFGPGAPKTSKLDPARDYLMRFIRWVAADDTQIDRIIFAAAGRKYPAPKKYGLPISEE